MRSTNALLALAGAVAFGGLGPMAYVLLRQWKDRRARTAALLRMDSARAIVSKGEDVNATARALAAFDNATVDRTLEQLLSEPSSPERTAWIVALADRC
ncbi:MAG TPA: hypothetical protein VGI70_11795, partial [Polyangiales bacterium]